MDALRKLRSEKLYDRITNYYELLIMEKEGKDEKKKTKVFSLKTEIYMVYTEKSITLPIKYAECV